MSTSIFIENTTPFLFHPAESQVPPAHSALEPIHLRISDKAQTALLHHKYLPILSVLGMHSTNTWSTWSYLFTALSETQEKFQEVSFLAINQDETF